MADLPNITYVDGAPSATTNGEVQTISQLSTRLGEVQATPTANTLLDRMKALNTSIQQLVTALGSTSLAFGAGAGNARTVRVTIDTDQLGGDPVITDDAPYTPGTAMLAAAGFLADETATDSVDEGDAGAGRMTLDRKVIMTPQPHTAGGLSIYRSIDLDEGTLEVVKASPGQLYGIWVTNTATATRFVKFYNATSGTVGTGTPVITIGIPGNTSDDVSGLFSSTHGITFNTGICAGASTAAADNDTGAPGTGDVILNAFYK